MISRLSDPPVLFPYQHVCIRISICIVYVSTCMQISFTHCSLLMQCLPVVDTFKQGNFNSGYCAVWKQQAVAWPREHGWSLILLARPVNSLGRLKPAHSADQRSCPGVGLSASVGGLHPVHLVHPVHPLQCYRLFTVWGPMSDRSRRARLPCIILTWSQLRGVKEVLPVQRDGFSALS